MFAEMAERKLGEINNYQINMSRRVLDCMSYKKISSMGEQEVSELARIFLVYLCYK